jgi:hypothetical protein
MMAGNELSLPGCRVLEGGLPAWNWTFQGGEPEHKAFCDWWTRGLKCRTRCPVTIPSKNLFSPIPIRWQYDGAVLPSELKMFMHRDLTE